MGEDERDLHFYKLIFEKSPEGILVVDIKTKKFVFANPKICNILGYKPSEILKLGVEDIHPKKEWPRILKDFERQAEGIINVSKEAPVLTKNKKIIYFDINTSPIKTGKERYMVGFFRDVTEQRRIEMELKERVDELEKFNRITVGRELRIAELKKKIKELKKKLYNTEF